MIKVFDKEKKNRIIIINGILDKEADDIGAQICGFLNSKVKVAHNKTGSAISFKADDGQMFFIKGWIMMLQYDGEIPTHVQFLGEE